MIVLRFEPGNRLISMSLKGNGIIGESKRLMRRFKSDNIKSDLNVVASIIMATSRDYQ